jgi:crotonobetainyl-CoA:carnitine CoA-transferase CaiB-like acyl-CoA transferase
MSTQPLPLAGVRVVDLTSIVLGPLASLTLAGLGADVVKVEAPEGDNVRNAGCMLHDDMGHVFLHGNRGKKSVVLDLKQPAARDALLRLVANADVFICNVRPAAMKRLGLGADAFTAVNPRLVHVTACGYASSGPHADKPAYDDLIQGAAGVPWLMQKHTGGDPRYVPLSLADRVTGLHLVYAVTSALYARERTGRGVQVEVPMFESVAHFVLADHLAGRTFEPAAGEAGYDRLVSTNRRPYPTADGHLCVLIYNDRHWQRFLAAIGQPERYTQDARFSSQAQRSRHIHEVYGFVGDVMRTRTTREWVALLDEIDIPNQVPNSLDDLLADPQLHASGLLSEQVHPQEGRMRVLGSPVTFAGTSPAVLTPAPRPGEDSVAVLREAGLSDEEMERMLASGATVQAG